MKNMPQSRITAQGQISIPADIRRKLGVGPGSVLEWEEEETGKVVVRKAGTHTWDDMHRILFPNGPPKRLSRRAMKEAIAQHLREKHARR
jgi:AbrB family looped-hinge helix DNA binding protein